MAYLLDGKALAESLKEQLRQEAQEKQDTAGLAVILVGDHPASQLYVKLKEKASQELGIHFERISYEHQIPQDIIISKIKELNVNPRISGIIVQLPLPQHLNVNAIISHIDPQKDVDGFHPDNIACLERDQSECLVSPVALGVMEMLSTLPMNLEGKTAVMLANSDLFSLPIKHLLQEKGIEMKTIFPTDEANLDVLKEADIVITAVGIPKFIKRSMVREGSILIDIGTNHLPTGTVVGDIDFEKLEDKAFAITPVPGGVGPMTVLMLLKNTLQAAK